ncbi:hypothetical protein ACROYT_G017285 [Oculina patagonica]
MAGDAMDVCLRGLKEAHKNSDNDYDYHYSNPSSARDDSGDGEEENSYDSCLSRLREKHTLPEFKLRCWARMVVNGTHKSEDNPPNVPFFTGNSKAASKSFKSQTSGEVSGQSTDGAERKAREAFVSRC